MVAFTAGSNETFVAHAEKDYTMTILTAGSGGSGGQGDIVSVADTMAGNGTATLTITDNTKLANGAKVKLIATLLKTSVSSKVKTTNLVKQLKVATGATDAFGTRPTDKTISLGRTDVFKLVGVFDSEDTRLRPGEPLEDLQNRLGPLEKKLDPVAEKVVEEVSPFQQSLNTGVASSLSPYYVGDNPTAANIAWGQQFGVDPRTMYMAEGGPIRQRYFLGKIVKKIGRAAKKVIKSPFGKAALLGFAGFGIPGGSGLTGGFFNSAMGKKLGMKMLMEKGAKDFTMASLDPFKAGIFGLTLAPFLMGDQDKEEEVAFDYAGAKEDYLNEMMRIRRAAQAGTLDPVQFPYQGIGPSYKDGGRIGYAGCGSEDPMLVDEYKKYVFEMEEMGLQPMSFEEFRRQALAGMASGGRAGYYAGGQSIPSENSLEDARKTAMQDRLGGITEVMKQADLYRQGDVGQMYMAEGGLMDLGGMEKDYRETGGFVDIGAKEKADDVPARLSVNEFVMTADAVRGAGDGDIDKGAERMEGLMEKLESKGKEENMKMAGPDWYIKRIEHLMFLGYDYDEAAEIAYDTEKYNEVIGSDPFARKQGASDMFEVSERLSEVV